MAIHGSWGYTNTSASTETITPVAVGANNYAVVVDAPGKCVIKNITSPIDQVESISFMSQPLGKISQEEKNSNPPKVGDYMLITAKIEGKKRLTSDTDDSFVVDMPLSTNISWRFPKTQYITSADLLEQLKRLIGILQDNSTDKFILDEMMLNQLNPLR